LWTLWFKVAQLIVNFVALLFYFLFRFSVFQFPFVFTSKQSNSLYQNRPTE
jgi:hypothetical protein